MKNILMVSLGCDKNLCDSEEMLGIVTSRGYNITNEEKDADIVVINTCSFIKDAMEESIDTILEMSALKKGRLEFLVVAGCMAERYKEQVMAEMPEVDAVIGTTAFEKVADVIDSLYDGKKHVQCFEPLAYLTDTTVNRMLSTNTFMAYLKIAEGCDKYCTYCAIPSFRGRYRSVPMEKLVAQAQMLAEQGVKELVVIAQETTCYGKDLYGEKKLPDLLRALSKIDGIEWIRLLYAYPEEITDALIQEMASNPKVCHYIDMPLQHTEDTVLKRMGRRITKQGIYDIVAKMRNAMPDIVIRTTLIAGFPGETEENHEDLMAAINELEFDRLGVFTYSPEEGTPAASFELQVPEEVANRYRDEIMELQQEISYDLNEKMIGSELSVIIEGYEPEEDVYVGRSFRDAPGVDGLVFVSCDYEPMSGSILTVKITGANEYDLIGEVVQS